MASAKQGFFFQMGTGWLLLGDGIEKKYLKCGNNSYLADQVTGISQLFRLSHIAFLYIKLFIEPTS